MKKHFSARLDRVGANRTEKKKRKQRAGLDHYTGVIGATAGTGLGSQGERIKENADKRWSVRMETRGFPSTSVITRTLGKG